MSYAVEKVLSDTRHYRQLAKTIRLASAMAAHQGGPREALSDCLTLQKFTPFLGGYGLLLEQLLGNGLEAFTHNNTLDVLSRSDSDIETLRWFQAQLNQTTTDSFPVSVDEERSFFYDFIAAGLYRR